MSARVHARVRSTKKEKRRRGAKKCSKCRQRRIRREASAIRAAASARDARAPRDMSSAPCCDARVAVRCACRFTPSFDISLSMPAFDSHRCRRRHAFMLILPHAATRYYYFHAADADYALMLPPAADAVATPAIVAADDAMPPCCCFRVFAAAVFIEALPMPPLLSRHASTHGAPARCRHAIAKSAAHARYIAHEASPQRYARSAKSANSRTQLQDVTMSVTQRRACVAHAACHCCY